MVGDRIMSLFFVALMAGGFLAWQFQVVGKDSAADPGGLVVHGVAEVDFGEALAGKFVKRTFKLRNTSGSPVKITGLRATCGCLIAKPKTVGTILPSNQTFEFPVAINTTARSGRVAVAIQMEWCFTDGASSDKAATAAADPPARHYLPMRLVGEVRGLINAEPSELDFAAVRPGEVHEQYVRISRADGGDLGQVRIAISGPGLAFHEVDPSDIPETATPRPMDEHNKPSRWISVRFNPDETSVGTRVEGALNLECEDIKEVDRHGHIHIQATIVSKLRCQPDSIVLIAPNRIEQAVLWDTSDGMSVTEVTLCDTLAEALVIDREIHNGFRARLKQKPGPEDERTAIEGQVLIQYRNELGDEFQSTIRVLVVR